MRKSNCFFQHLHLLLGQDNAHHYFVATQDVELRRKLRRIPGEYNWPLINNTLINVHTGVPLLYINRNTLILEGVSDNSRDQAEQVSGTQHKKYTTVL